MLPLACILLLAASRVELVDEVYQIPANEWRYVELGLNQKPAFVTATYEVISGQPSLRLALLTAADLDKLKAGAPHSVMDVTSEAARGILNHQVREPGDYVLVIDNQGRTPASVRTRIWLDFARRGPAVTQLSRRRQLAIVVISFAVFFGIVTFSARRLLKLVRR
jgi:hypothetical protein